MNDNQNQGTYYQPQVNTANQPERRHKGLTSIVITIIVCITIVVVVSIVCTFSWLSGGKINVNPVISDHTDYISGSADVATDGINVIDIEWVNGSVSVEYYDGDKIAFSESSSDPSNPMCYKIEENTLEISEYINSKSSFKDLKSKELTVKIPESFEAASINFEVVSANVTAKSLNTRSFDAESVSGDITVTFASQPQLIDIECVSADAFVYLPENTTGYTLDMETVSGKFNGPSQLQNGDGFTKIDFESVSGDLTLEKSEK